MKRGGLIVIYGFLFLLLLTIGIYFNNTLTGNVVISAPSDCSTSNIKSLWESIFNENSNNLIIYTNDTYYNSSRCDAFFAYKNESTTLYILYGLSGYYSPLNNSESIYATTINASPTLFSILEENASTFVNSQTGQLTAYVYITLPTNDTNNRQTNITSSNLATSKILEKFKSNLFVDTISWDPASEVGIPNEYPGYSFVYENSSESSNQYNQTITTGLVFGSLNREFLSIRTIKYPITSCASNWTAVNTSCNSNDIRTIWYNDTKSCGTLSGMPSNITSHCDYNGNGVIGNLSTISQVRTNLDVYIESALLNDSIKYNSTKKIELRDDNVTIVEFAYSFSQPLNLKNLTITKQSAISDYGYLIVNGIEIQKNITIDKIGDFSEKVCVKNTIVDEISNISNSCNKSNEYIINRPGSNSSITCIPEHFAFKITGLSSSAAKEILSEGDEIVECIENWTCDPWSTCLDNIQERTCTDLNECGTLINEPQTSQTCVSCVPRWNCTSWTPEVCPKTQNQTRTCTDTNSCNILINKPDEINTCEYKNNSLIWFIVSIITVLIIIITIIIIYALNKSKTETEEPSFAPTYITRPSPPSNGFQL